MDRLARKQQHDARVAALNEEQTASYQHDLHTEERRLIVQQQQYWAQQKRLLGMEKRIRQTQLTIRNKKNLLNIPLTEVEVMQGEFSDVIVDEKNPFGDKLDDFSNLASRIE